MRAFYLHLPSVGGSRAAAAINGENTAPAFAAVSRARKAEEGKRLVQYAREKRTEKSEGGRERYRMDGTRDRRWRTESGKRCRRAREKGEEGRMPGIISLISECFFGVYIAGGRVLTSSFRVSEKLCRSL